MRIGKLITRFTLIALVLSFAIPVSAQIWNQPARRIAGYTTAQAPSTCTAADVYYDLTLGTLFLCNVSNAYVAVLGATGNLGGTPTIDPYGNYAAAKYTFVSTAAGIALHGFSNTTGAGQIAIGTAGMATSSGTATPTALEGLDGEVYHNASGAASNVQAVYGYVEGNGGNIAAAAAVRADGVHMSAGTATAASSLRVTTNGVTGTGVITTSYGVLVDNQTGGGTNYSIYTGTGKIRFGDNIYLTDDAILSRKAAANLQFGDADAAVPVAQTVSFQGSRGATDTNVAGADATIRTSLGTGTAAGSQLLFKAGTPQATGTTSHVANTALSIKDFGLSNTQRAVVNVPSGSSLIADGNIKFVTADFQTAANTSLQTITGLTYTMPANRATNIPFRCELSYFIATAAVAVDFGIQDATVAPTQINARGVIYTSATAVTAANINALTTTTATSIVSATPSAITTIWNAHIDGFIEQPSNAAESVINIMVKTAAAADLVTVKRGSFCTFGF